MGWLVALGVLNLVILTFLCVALARLHALVVRGLHAIGDMGTLIDERAQSRTRAVKLADGEKRDLAKRVVHELRQPVEPRY